MHIPDEIVKEILQHLLLKSLAQFSSSVHVRIKHLALLDRRHHRRASGGGHASEASQVE